MDPIAPEAENKIRKTFTRKKQLKTDLAHISQEMYRRNRELAEINKTLSLLRTIDALVLESHASLQTVCKHIAEAITQVTDYPFVGLFTRPSQANKELTLYGWSAKDWPNDSPEPQFREPVHLHLTNEWLNGMQSSLVIPTDTLSSLEIASFLKCTESEGKTIKKCVPLKSLYVVKLRVRRRLVGLLVAGFYNSSDQLAEADTLLIDRLSDSIGVALDNKLLFEENQRVLEQLKRNNEKLKELDETKDEFLSMASHQLRTPLTSIKGYLSMVLEGDAGKLTDKQYQLLNQAFVSSQRMVYLIADLLNVSRLKTGKFVVDTAPSNLAEVVEGEIAQLKEIAKNKKLTLTYHKPKTFPELMLDETKTRQVIMNFADNAIHYTPAGGHIEISLTADARNVYFMVKDDGLGIPENEKEHMFTKFYRAKNARSARPDGTGLGLFMAKKVISAQGGHILFESTEGKGSLFGFTFDIKKHHISSKQ